MRKPKVHNKIKQTFKRLNFTFWKRLPAREKRLTIPTVLTIVRILLSPLIVSCMISQIWGWTFILFVGAAITDLLDGSIARLWNAKTFLGACLDPIADKLLLLSCFMTLAFVQSPLFSIPLWFVLVVLIRELLLISGVVSLLLIRGYVDIHPTYLGKLTTVVQMIFIIWLFACYFFHWVPIKTYFTMLGLMLSLTIISFLQYARIGTYTWYDS